MSKNLFKKIYSPFLIAIILLVVISPMRVSAIAIREITADPDPCLAPNGPVGLKADTTAIKALGTSAAIVVPVQDTPGDLLLLNIRANACATQKATTAVKNKTVGPTLLGIPKILASLGIPTSWDGIYKLAMKAVIKKLTDDTVNWINGNTDGKPKFVTDPGQYFTDVANGLASDFIEGADSPLNFLCTPFAQNIKLSLKTNYATRQSYNPQCTFTGIAGFLKDGFNRGGWQDWFSVTQNPENNPYDSYLNAQVELDSRVQSLLKIKQDQLNWGSGFLSIEKCDKTYVEGNDDPAEKCHTVTPGSVVGTQLNKVLGLGTDDLTLARSFDDVVSALIGALSRKVFSNNGLLSDGGYSGGGKNGVETGDGLASGPQDFGPGTDPTSGVTCAPDKTNALFNDPVTWTTTTTEVEGVTYSYEWSGSDVPAGSTDSVLVMNYAKEGNKIATVKITATQKLNDSSIPTTQTSTINCSPGVMVAQYAPLVINSCTATAGEAKADEISPFEIDTTGERRIRMARVTWVANISGGSGVLAVNKPIIWSGEDRDESRHIIQTREFGKPTKQMDVPMWTPSYFWLGGKDGHYDYVGGSNGTTQTITKNSDGSTTISISRLYEILNAETTRDVSAKLTVRDANVFIENNGVASRDCKPPVFLYKP